MHIGDASKMKLLTLRSYFDNLYNSFYNIVVYKI